MIEKILYQFLSSATSVKVYTEVPSKPATEYIVIERTGGGEVNYIRSATVAIQSVGKRMIRAVEINEELIRRMTDDDGLRSVPEIASVSLNSTYNFTDPETKSYRYQAVFDLTYYAE
jgi:hypothetical protein